MKRYALLVCCLLFGLPAAYAQAPKTSLKDLIGIVWYPVQRQGAHSPFFLRFDSEKDVSGSDGCNSFHGYFSYSAKHGFRLGESLSTDKYCPQQKEYFGHDFLRHAKTFLMEGDKLTFYDAAGKEIISLYKHIVIDTSPPPTDELPLLPKE